MPGGREIRTHFKDSDRDNKSRPKRTFYHVEGVIHSKTSLEDMCLSLPGRGQGGRDLEVPLIANDEKTSYKFTFPQLSIGDYNLKISTNKHPSLPFKVAISGEGRLKTKLEEGISLSIDVKEEM